MKDPLVSVVIPSYNYAHYLPEAIDSALAQTFQDIEVVVVDDGSKDNTRDVVQSYAQNPRVRYIHQENRGLSAARNTGIRNSRGEFIALLDADDRWKPDKLQRQLARIQTDGPVGLVFCGRETFNEEGAQGELAVSEKICDEIIEHLTTTNLFCPSSALIRKKCFDDCGYFDESLKKVEDREMWIRIAKRYAFRCVEANLVEWRLHGTAWNLNPDGMEEAFSTTLRRAFADGPLRGRFLLRCRAYAFMHFDFSWIYHAARQHWKAWWHVVLSILCYPLPDFGAKIFKQRFARLKRLVRYTLKPHTV